MFCPRCGECMGNSLLAPSIDGCVHERHGALAYCTKCGIGVFGDETAVRKSMNTKWAVAAAGCAVVAFVMFFLSNPARISPGLEADELRKVRGIAQTGFTIGVFAIAGIVFCLYQMKLFGDRDN